MVFVLMPSLPSSSRFHCTGSIGLTHILNWVSLLSVAMSFIGLCEPLVSMPGTHLSLVSTCGNTSTLVWSLSQKNLKMCELTVHRIDQQRADIIDIHPHSPHRQIQLFNLAAGESYTTFLVCDGNKRTNDVTFIVGSLCDPANNSNTNKSSSAEPEGTGAVKLASGVTFDTISCLSAVFFSCLGLTLVCVVAFYSWKKYQHRQRIQRIFRHEQNDPFQALYSPTQDSYSV